MIAELGAYAVVVVAGFLAATALLCAMVLLFGRRDVPLFCWVMPAILFKAGISPLLLDRSLAGAGAWTVLADDAQNSTLGWISRLVSLLIGLAFVQACYGRLGPLLLERFSAGRQADRSQGRGVAADGTDPSSGHKRPVGPLPRLGADQRLMLLATMVFFLCSIVAPALFSAHPSISHEYLYLTAVCVTGLIIEQRSRYMAIQWLRNSVLVFVAASLALMILKPDSVLDFSYGQGILGHLPRFSGLAPHPVAMGMVGLIGWILLLEYPLDRRWLQYVALAGLAVAIVLAQSKLSWLTGAVCLGLYWARWNLIKGDPADFRARARRRRALFGLAFAAALALLLIPIGLTVFSASIDRFLASGEAQSMATGTGRDVIWQVALSEWQRHPVFGYGMELFDKFYRESVGLLYATHGHNQIVDSLARTGLVGTMGVLLFLAAAVVVLFRMGRGATGLAGYMFLLLLLRSGSEVPFVLYTYGIESIPVVLMLITLDRQLAGRPGPVPVGAHWRHGPILAGTRSHASVGMPGHLTIPTARTGIARALIVDRNDGAYR